MRTKIYNRCLTVKKIKIMPIGLGTASLFQSGGNFAMNLINRAFRKRDIRENVRVQKELQDYSFDKNLEAWRMQNEYNSPIAQMDRLQDAGLNPNLVYGSGSTAGLQSGPSPKYNMPGVDTKKPGLDQLDVIGAYQSIKMMQAQIANVESNTKLTEARERNEGVKTLLNQIGLDFQQETMDSRIKINKQQLINLEKDLEIKEQVRLKAFQDAIQAKFGATLSSYGLTAQDNTWVRVLAMSALQQGMTPKEFHDSMKKGFKNFWERLTGPNARERMDLPQFEF